MTALRQVPPGVWEEIRAESTLTKGLAFAMAVIQGCLVARQLFGSAGLTRWYPLGSIQVVNAIWFLVGRPLLTMDGSEPGLDDLCHCVGQVQAVDGFGFVCLFGCFTLPGVSIFRLLLLLSLEF